MARGKTFRVGLYARGSTQDQQTLPMQLAAMRDYAKRRGWIVATESKEVGSGAKMRPLREELLKAARRRDALAGMLSVFAAFERAILRDRVRAGIAAARKTGKAHGRPITIQKHLPEIRRLHAAGTSKREIAKRLKIARTSVRRLLEASPARRRPLRARARKAA